MPECHKCEHDGKRSKRCLACRGPGGVNHKGRSHVSIDAGGAQTLGEVEASLATAWRRDDVERGMPSVHPDAVKVASAFLTMSDGDFRLVKALAGGKSMAGIARDTGLTRAAVSAQVRRLAGRHPVFAFLRRNFKGGA